MGCAVCCISLALLEDSVWAQADVDQCTGGEFEFSVYVWVQVVSIHANRRYILEHCSDLFCR